MNRHKTLRVTLFYVNILYCLLRKGELRIRYVLATIVCMRDMINYEVQIVWLWRNWSIPWWWKLEITCEKSYLGYDKNLSEWSRVSKPLFNYYSDQHDSSWVMKSYKQLFWRVVLLITNATILVGLHCFLIFSTWKLPQTILIVTNFF